MNLLAHPHLAEIETYIPGKSSLGSNLGDKKIIKLSSNENALGASPKAIEAHKITLKKFLAMLMDLALRWSQRLRKKIKFPPIKLFAAPDPTKSSPS